MPKKFPSIDLIKDQKGDLLERVINWALSMGRILVIVTELIALGAFLWRFGLDQQLIDLHTQIKQKQAIVEAFRKNEDEYRNLQDRLAIAANYSSVGTQRLTIYKDILSLATPEITLNKISLSTDRIFVEINVTSVSALSSFVDSLKKYQATQSVSIDKIETKTSSAIIVVGISINLKPIPNKYATETQ